MRRRLSKGRKIRESTMTAQNLCSFKSLLVLPSYFHREISKKYQICSRNSQKERKPKVNNVREIERIDEIEVSMTGIIIITIIDTSTSWTSHVRQKREKNFQNITKRKKSSRNCVERDEINAINANFASIDLDDENLFDFASSNKKFSPNDSMNPINFKSPSDTFEWRMNDDHRKDQTTSRKKKQQQWNWKYGKWNLFEMTLPCLDNHKFFCPTELVPIVNFNRQSKHINL